MRMRLPWHLAVVCLLVGPAFAEPLTRNATPAGSVIARRSGEEDQFIDLSGWTTVVLAQDLLAGDVLRTNATGNLAVMFADRTQMRLARNTTIVVKKVGAASDSVFELQRGSLWGRAARGGQGLMVETPAAAAASGGARRALARARRGRARRAVPPDDRRRPRSNTASRRRSRCRRGRWLRRGRSSDSRR